MKILFLFIIPVLIYSDSLKFLLDFALKNNELIESKNIRTRAKESQLKSSKSNYYPTIDIGGFYKRDDAPTPFQPGTVYSGFAKVGFDIYSGGRKAYDEKEKKNAFISSQYDYKANKREIELSIVQDFYSIKNNEAKIEALKDAIVAVSAQLERIKQFYDAKLATYDDVNRLEAAYKKNIYLLESVKFHKFTVQKSLEIKVGKDIHFLNDSKFMRPSDSSIETLDSIKALQYTQNSLLNASQKIDSYYYPQVRIEDTYSLYGYQDKPNFGALSIDYLSNQNTILATMNMRLFDFSRLSEAKEALRLNAYALAKQISYKIKEQKMQQELAYMRIKTVKFNIKSSKSALKASISALETITKKYNNGIVDNVVYLDALSSKTEAQATYKSAINSLEVAYALYYYYNGKNLKEFLDD